jgi:hypothetical protein
MRQLLSLPRGPSASCGACSIVTLALAACICLASCWNDPTDDAPYVRVLLATLQPQSDDLGVLVTVQTKGGDYLSLVADRGSVRLLPSGDGGGGTPGACVPTRDGSLVSFLVIPAQTEAILFANLYNLQSPPNGSTDSYCQTTSSALATSVTPIAHAANPGTVPAEDADSAPDDAEVAPDESAALDALDSFDLDGSDDTGADGGS